MSEIEIMLQKLVLHNVALSPKILKKKHRKRYFFVILGHRYDQLFFFHWNESQSRKTALFPRGKKRV
jgi:hypothetical protein